MAVRASQPPKVAAPVSRASTSQVRVPPIAWYAAPAATGPSAARPFSNRLVAALTRPTRCRGVLPSRAWKTATPAAGESSIITASSAPTSTGWNATVNTASSAVQITPMASTMAGMLSRRTSHGANSAPTIPPAPMQAMTAPITVPEAPRSRSSRMTTTSTAAATRLTTAA